MRNRNLEFFHVPCDPIGPDARIKVVNDGADDRAAPEGLVTFGVEECVSIGGYVMSIGKGYNLMSDHRYPLAFFTSLGKMVFWRASKLAIIHA
jgi:hypothetical protein